MCGGRNMVEKPADKTCETPTNIGATSKLLHDIVDRSNNHALLMEFFYWSCDPGLVKFLRQYIGLPEVTKVALSAFLTANQNNLGTVKVETIGNGTIMLSCAGAAPAAEDTGQLRDATEARKLGYTSH
jgi:hypothetical protein